jgi:uncharacterized protein YdiU (UPF0061 family)
VLKAVVQRQAALIADWMRVGFIHGVMNTDNMAISGETIDYGPCAFMDTFDPATVFSSIDHGGRYAYGNQPVVAQWNLARLAEALLPLIHDDQEKAIELARAALDGFPQRYDAAWSAGMRAKLGLPEGVDQTVVVDDFLALLRANRVDHTSIYRALAATARGDAEATRRHFREIAAIDDWVTRWRARGPDPDAMDRVNPVYIPRNHLVEEALAAATDGDLTPLEQLVDAVSAPYDERPGLDRFAAPAPPGFGFYQTFCGT